MRETTGVHGTNLSSMHATSGIFGQKWFFACLPTKSAKAYIGSPKEPKKQNPKFVGECRDRTCESTADYDDRRHSRHAVGYFAGCELRLAVGIGAARRPILSDGAFSNWLQPCTNHWRAAKY